jgi:MFS family permease
VPASLIGAFVGLVYVGAMVASLLSGAYIARHGAIRVSQACVIACALGIAGVAVAGPATLALVVLAAIVLGAGYGPITPASSDVLARTTPPSRMSLVFSIKQTGVPAGAALAGASLPALDLVLGWRGALALAAGLGVAVALAAQPVRETLDTHRRADATVALRNAFAAVRAIFRPPRARDDRVAVVRVRGDAGVPDELPGRAPDLAARLVARRGRLRAVGRHDRGRDRAHRVGRARGPHAAAARRARRDRPQSRAPARRSPRSRRPAWPALAIYVVVAAFGATAIGWNGVMLAEVARLAPAGEAGATTGATGFVTFGGVVAGPPIFGALGHAHRAARDGFVALAAALAVTGRLIPAALTRELGPLLKSKRAFWK